MSEWTYVETVKLEEDLVTVRINREDAEELAIETNRDWPYIQRIAEACRRALAEAE